MRINAGSDRSIGTVHGFQSAEDGIRQEAFANASLIAAAPELLDICESILAEVDYEGLNLESGRVAKLRAVIAKATAQ